MIGEGLLRSLILSSAASPAINRLVRRYGKKFGAYRFVAGETLPEALDVVADLNRGGLWVTLDRLGEGRVDEAYARGAASAYGEILTALQARTLDASLSLKLTQLGLDLSPELSVELLDEVLSEADRASRMVRIDMEDSAHTAQTLEVFEQVHQAHPTLGIVIQAYLYRSGKDLEHLADLGANVRIVKGAYREGPQVAFPDKAQVDESYLKLMEFYLEHGAYTAIATHDEALITRAKEFISRKGVPTDRFEFQMLYGINTKRLSELAAQGFRCRVYVPFGADWYPYFMRRLAERPANLGFFLRHLTGER